MVYELVPSPWAKKAVPYALTAIAGVGVVGTAVLAATATPKALEKKAEAEKEKGEPLTTWESFKAMFPSYLPAAGTGAVTLASIAGIVLDSNKKQAELAAIVASGNQIINRIGKKYSMLREDVKQKEPEIIKEFDKKSFDDQWNEYVETRLKKRGYCWGNSLPLENSSEYGETRRFGIEYGNGLTDENGHEFIFFDATPGDIIAAFYNLNGLFRQDGIKKVNDLFKLLNLPKTDLGDRLVWDPNVMWEEWESDFIHFYTEDLPLEDDVPEPAVITMIYFSIPPLAEGYAEGMGIPSCQYPEE